MADIRIRPGDALIQFTASDALHTASMTFGTQGLKLLGKNTSSLTRMTIEGNHGTIFEVFDDDSGNLFSISDSSGNPIFEVETGDRVLVTGSVDITSDLGVNGSVTTDLVPDSNDSYNVGTGITKWKGGYFGSNGVTSEGNLFAFKSASMGKISSPNAVLDVEGDTQLTGALYIQGALEAQSSVQITDRLGVTGSAEIGGDSGIGTQFYVESGTGTDFSISGTNVTRVSRFRRGTGGTWDLASEGNGFWFHNGLNNSGFHAFSTRRSLSNVERMRILNNGNVGIATNSPGARLGILQSGEGSGTGIRLIDDDDVNDYWDIAMDSTDDLHFYYVGSSRGYLDDASDVAQIDFTGQHRSISNIDGNKHLGKIVISDGKYKNFNGTTKPSINESLPIVKLSYKECDKRVFGVISGQEDTGSLRTYEVGAFVSTFEKTGSSSEERIIINSLGEGAMWVSNYNGNLENGDYITSSPIKGLGMKQNDDLLHNYTVAKITQDCNFNLSSSKYDCNEIEFSGSNYKKAFVGVTYHCG